MNGGMRTEAAAPVMASADRTGWPRGTPGRAALLALALMSGAAPARGAEPAGDLRAAIDTILERSALAGARVGILVSDVESGRVLYARDADALLNPASNVKLFTSAAALARLGPEFRFETEFRVDGPSARRSQVRQLYVRGKGDPTLVTERLWAIAGELANLGIRRIGELVLDDGYFDEQRVGPGFEQEAGDRAYLAPTGALSLNFNSVAIHASPGEARGQPGRVALEPQSDYLELVNRTRTVGPRAVRRLVPSSAPAGARQRIVVEGRLPLDGRPVAVWRKIDDPRAYFGQTLKRLLELRGVKVGRVRAGAAPEDAKLVHVAESDTLGAIVRRLNKSSNNFVAEQLLKTLGAELRGAPGTWAGGVDVVEEFLAEVGLPRGAYVMSNGSGLNDANRFSARQTVTLLRAMWRRFPLAAEFLSSLPVAGRDGTTRWRMDGTEAEGRLRAKTGTLENVTSLSGYVETAGGQRLAFAILVNDFAGRTSRAARAVDALAAALAAQGGGAGRLQEAVALVEPPPPAPGRSLQDQRAAVQTWQRLAQAGDRRNLALLRTALRAERDPVIRLAIAECIVQSDPDGDSAQRAFLDTVAASGEALPRLAALSEDPSAPFPILPALAGLAAEGDAEAMARLLELAPALSADPRLQAALGDALAGVAQSAPQALVEALGAAPSAIQEPAAAALALGVLRGDDDERPFEHLLRELAAGREGQEGAFARALEGRLQAAEAAARAPRPSDLPAIGPVPSAEGPEPRSGG